MLTTEARRIRERLWKFESSTAADAPNFHNVHILRKWRRNMIEEKLTEQIIGAAIEVHKH